MFKNEIRSTTLNTPTRREVNPPVSKREVKVGNKVIEKDDILNKLNLYFEYEAKNMFEFNNIFRSEYKDENYAVDSLINFINTTIREI